MAVSVAILGGKNEIGGNKIILEHKNTRIMLDFGLSFNLYKKYFSEFLVPRKCNPLYDYMEFGILPNVKGLYREDYCRYCGFEHTKKPFVDAVFLSHAHLDHSGLIHFLRKDIPIFCTEETFLILKALEETSGGSFRDFVNLKREFHLVRNKRGGYRRLHGEEAKIPRNFVIMEPYRKYQINETEVRALPVDHSLPGACGFIVYTDSGNVVYTGDLRFHGRRGKDTEKFVKIAKSAEPEIMLCEGTRINEIKNVTEEDVERSAGEVINSSRGLVVVNYPLRDLDRLLTFYRVAKDTERTLVVNLKQAYLLKLFEKTGDYPKPDEVAVYVDRKGWGLMSDEFFVCVEDEGWVKCSEIGEREIERDYSKWEREFLHLENVVTYKELRENPDSYIFRCDNFELNELVDIKPRNGIYIRSMTEPFSEDMVIEEKRVRNWLEHFNLLPVHHIHASGHANGLEIREMLKEISPRKIIPIHTEHEEMFF